MWLLSWRDFSTKTFLIPIWGYNAIKDLPTNSAKHITSDISLKITLNKEKLSALRFVHIESCAPNILPFSVTLGYVQLQQKITHTWASYLLFFLYIYFLISFPHLLITAEETLFQSTRCGWCIIEKPFVKCVQAIQKSWVMNVHPHSARETCDLHDVPAVSQVPLPDRRLSGWLIGNLLPEVTLLHVLHGLICLLYKHRLFSSINVQISNVIIESPKDVLRKGNIRKVFLWYFRSKLKALVIIRIFFFSMWKIKCTLT